MKASIINHVYYSGNGQHEKSTRLSGDLSFLFFFFNFHFVNVPQLDFFSIIAVLHCLIPVHTSISDICKVSFEYMYIHINYDNLHIKLILYKYLYFHHSLNYHSNNYYVQSPPVLVIDSVRV